MVNKNKDDNTITEEFVDPNREMLYETAQCLDVVPYNLVVNTFDDNFGELYICRRYYILLKGCIEKEDDKEGRHRVLSNSLHYWITKRLEKIREGKVGTILCGDNLTYIHDILKDITNSEKLKDGSSIYNMLLESNIIRTCNCNSKKIGEVIRGLDSSCGLRQLVEGEQKFFMKDGTYTRKISGGLIFRDSGYIQGVIKDEKGVDIGESLENYSDKRLIRTSELPIDRFILG